MQVGDTVNVQLKGENVVRENVTITDLNLQGLWYGTNNKFAWKDIDDIETISYKPAFSDGARVVFQNEEYVRFQSKWYKVTNHTDAQVADAVAAGTATVQEA